MDRIRFLTAGESHGKAVTVILEGMPAGMPLKAGDIDRELERRQAGHGRGGRMKIEKDRVEIFSGIRHGKTLGSPICLVIFNRDWQNWQVSMSVEATGEARPETIPRPGHADLPGAMKFGFTDVRNVLERASARETAARVAAGAAVRTMLSSFGIMIYSRVTRIGNVSDDTDFSPPRGYASIEKSPVRCFSAEAGKAMTREIDRAGKQGDTLGGVFEVIVTGLPVGLGSYTHWDRRLDGRLAQAIMSIQAIKGVESGDGFQLAAKPGSLSHDEIFHAPKRGFYRRTNRAGGLEGGVTNGCDLVVRAAMKPIASLTSPLKSADLETGRKTLAMRERSDVCAVPAAAVVGEAMTALVLGNSFLEKFGGDSISEIRKRM